MVENEKEANNSASTVEAATTSTTSTRPGTIDAILPPVSVEKRKELHKKFALWIVRNSRPLGIGESDIELRDIFNFIFQGGYAPPTYKLVTQLILELFVEGKNKVKAQLLALIQEGIIPSVAGDIWSEGGGIAIFGILVYFIDAHGVYHQKLLGAAIPFGDVRHNVVEIQKATKRCAVAMGIGAYKLGDEDTDADSPVIIEDTVSDFVHATVSDSTSNIVSGWGCFDGHECNCHLSALCVLTFLESSGVKETFRKLRGMTTHFNHSVIGRKLLHECQDVYGLSKSSPPQDNATRSGWKGARNQAKWFKENQMDLLEWDIVKEALYILDLTTEAIDLLQTTSSPTAGIVLPVVGGLINKIDLKSKIKYQGKHVAIVNEDVKS
ncbi:hypothetical protein CYMTET_40705 [Cymbomonas tetramitiformis]|uniref:Uncharacterized protein n=1 Tax=Cymbomonas tetramitiformis TaxID=36881 RepID=A0AAE0C999_9CHLO|nr:hypothetical protein CYMTET_40705 [Cymbomonas tetramitiformis]